ncbi:MAG TPA: protein kinase [Pyrinomonadaceae bacterium]|jgi:serine/threonine-protein kinase
MKAEEWERIESLFHEARALAPEARAVYLDGACSGDAALRAEVESLLAACKGREHFMEEPAFDLGLKVLAASPPDPLAGRLIGPYKILKQLGRGGMGEVYLAEDTRLGRRVALKFLSAKLVDDTWAKRQLTKEAQAVAILDHPNICAVHGIEEAEGYSFIAMQYAEGDTLAALIRKHLPDIPRAVSLAVQIAGAVAEAHAHGIIHRDIKPQNIVVTPTGQVKVLDFGLAKSVQLKRDAGPLAEDTSQISNSGLVVGTVAYMSPEQLRAERLDFRSDIFSIGAVLYETVCGKKPFARDSNAEVISAILTSRPAPLTREAGDVPPELSRIIFKCLEKHKEQRYQSASELIYELSRLQEGSAPPVPFWSALARRAATVLLLLVVLAAALLFVSRLRPAKERTLALLPIANPSAAPELEPLSDGLTEDLINKLSRLSALRVKALTTISGYKGRQVDPLKVGRGLGVEAVLVGALTRQGESLVLQFTLLDTSDGTQLWGDKFTVRPEQILDLQDEVSEKVTSQLAPAAGYDDKKLLELRPTQNAQALTEYYQGHNLWEKRSKENFREIVAHYERAVELDASYARAYAGLADCYVQMNTPAYGNMPAAEAMNKAKYMATKAIEIDNNLPEAHTSLGVVLFKFEWNWPEAEKEFRRAINIKPNNAWAHYWYSQLLSVMGRADEAIAHSRTASDLAPFSSAARNGLCRAFYLARQYDTAESCYGEILARDPGNVNTNYLLSYTYLKQARYAEAIRILENFYAKNRSLAAAPLGFAYGKNGEAGKALKILQDMQEISKTDYLPPQERAIIYIGLGDNDKAFYWLEKSYAEHFSTLNFLTAEPIYEDLRSDPRFAPLARRINLTPEGAPPS